MVQSRGGLALVLTGALLLSAVWLVACWVYVRDYVGLENLGYLQPLEIATGITALVAPLIVVWMAALFIGRAGSLRRETRSLLGRLDGLTYADHAATGRVGEITQALKAQTELLAAATDASVSRVETLRQALAEETRNLGALAEASGAAAAASQARLAELLSLAARQQGQAAAEVAAAEPLLRAGGAGLERAAADLKVLSQQALAELRRSLDELQSAAQRLVENGSAGAGRLQAGAEGLLGLGQQIDDAGRAQAASLAQSVVAAEQRLAGFVGGLGQLDGAVQALLQRLDLDLAERGERLKSQLAARQRELVAAATAAEAAAGTVTKALEGEARQLATAARGVARELGAESDGLALAIGRLRAEAEAALGKAAALRKQGQGEARDAFLALASELVTELNRQTLDLHALLGEELPAEVWQRLKAGDGSAVARRLPRLRDRQGALAIVRRYEKDARFQLLADRFMAGFERLLAEAGAADPQHGLSAVFLTADVGRLYLVLARATGRSTGPSTAGRSP